MIKLLLRLWCRVILQHRPVRIIAEEVLPSGASIATMEDGRRELYPWVCDERLLSGHMIHVLYGPTREEFWAFQIAELRRHMA